MTRPPQLAIIGGDLQFKVGSEPPLPQFYSTYISHARTWIPEVNADGKNPGCRGFELATLRSRVGLLTRSATEAVKVSTKYKGKVAVGYIPMGN